MRVIDIGEDFDAYVIGGIHGDEPCGKEAIETIVSKEMYPKDMDVRFIIANEKALEEGERYIQKDLNRCFPGDKNGEHEEKLAYKITELLDYSTPILSLHSSLSTPEIFGLIFRDSNINREICFSCGIDKVAEIEEVSYNSLPCVFKENSVEVECGLLGDSKTVKNALNITKRFLYNIHNKKNKLDSFDLYRITEMVEGSGYTFKRKNFELVKDNEIFATKEGSTKRAKEDFYPILMSTEGYEDIIGFKSDYISQVHTDK
jgi:hypothetical protein